jgi:hypothetical protein
MDLSPEMIKRHAAKLIVLLLLAAAGCSNDVQENELNVEYGSPPRFVVSGPHAIRAFRISGPDLDREPNPDGSGERLMLLKVYWEIVPTRSATNRNLDDIKQIEYAKLPEGFIQTAPAHGALPPPLVEGYKYGVTLTPTAGRWSNYFFLIRDGKLISEKEN